MKRSAVILLLISLASSTFAQKEYAVFDWRSEQTLTTFLMQEVHHQFGEREVDLKKALSSKPSLIAYQDSVKARYKKLLGTFSKRSDLNVKVNGTIQRNGYRIEKILYESIPNHHVTANLYIPEGKGPFPATLLFCGHEAESKATASYQKTAILFALNGFVVLVIDPISQGERYQLTDEKGVPLTRGGTTEHTLVNAAANLVGSGAVAWQLWDNIRGLDYLVTRKEVDPSRIGCLGNSGGGTQTAYFIAYDERIKVAAPCSYTSRRERNLELSGPNDGCQHVPYEGSAKLEMSDFLISFSPKPLLILAGRYDFVDYTGVEEVYAELQKVYSILGQQEKTKLFTVDDGHGISQPKREEAVRWFKRWLSNDDRSVHEGRLPVLTQQELNATVQWQVNGLPNEVNDFKRSIILADDFASNREAKKDLKQAITRTLKLQLASGNISQQEAGSVIKSGYTVNKIIVRREGHMPLPVLTIFPATQKPKQVILWLHDKGKQVIADSTLLIQKQISEGSIVIAADLSGLGEMIDSPSANDPKYFNKEYRNAMIALHVGKSLPAQRTTDILNLLDFIGQQENMKQLPVAVYCSGATSLSGLHAAVLDERIKSLSVTKTISSFYDILNNPMQKDWYSYVVPGVLMQYDIAQLKNFLGDRLK
ncbi:MAG TPA: acetylxylan esterase [Cyclobacteriaceae bacterium]